MEITDEELANSFTKEEIEAGKRQLAYWLAGNRGYAPSLVNSINTQQTPSQTQIVKFTVPVKLENEPVEDTRWNQLEID